MGKNPETRLVNSILKYLKTEGGWWMKVHGSPFQVSGVPDILGCYEGHFIALEAKMPSGQTTARQDWIMEKIHRAGGISVVVYNVEQVSSVLSSVRRKLMKEKT